MYQLLKQKPKEYQCSKCGFETNYTRVIKVHRRLPDNELPVGLVFKWDSFKHPSIIVKRVGYKESIMKDDFDRDFHDVRYGYVFSRHPIMKKYVFGITTEDFVDGLKFGTIRLYSEEDFERIKNLVKSIAQKHKFQLLRTDERLETILSQSQKNTPTMH